MSPSDANDALANEVFVTGGTGYVGRELIEALSRRGVSVRALVRNGSEAKLPRGAEAVVGDVFDSVSTERALAPGSTVVHLVGTSKPAPWKAREFETVDGAALAAVLEAARTAQIGHFVYVSVAQPAPVMKAYVRVRAECEARLRASGLAVTILRPWYVLGPGHRWPYALVPLYWLAERLPATAAGARRLGLISLAEMIAALVWAVEHPAEGVRVLEVPEMRRLAREERG
jgi:uncharacterized protein YbjT (DUF2867 family)